MKFTIKSILLWPKNPQKNVRTVGPFLPGKVNVITGDSQTGKSALIAIVDYVMAGGKCTIPIGKIRDKTEWFGLLIEHNEGELLLARREPGDAPESSDAYLLEGRQVSIPTHIDRNLSIDAVKDHLNRLANLTKLDIGGDDTSFSGRPSIRDFAAFEFQPQHIVANPHVLFYKTDTYEHKEKLKNVLPFALGVISNETLVLKQQLRIAKKELEIKRRQLEAEEANFRRVSTEIDGYIAKAKEFGLLPVTSNPKKPQEALDLLRSVPAKITSTSIPVLDRSATANAVREIEELNKREQTLGRQIASLRIRLRQLREFTSHVNDYFEVNETGLARIAGIDWFSRQLGKAPNCPFCGANNDKAHVQMQRLHSVVNSFRASTTAVKKPKGNLDKEISTIELELRTAEEELNSVRNAYSILSKDSHEAARTRHTLNDAFRFVGKLEVVINNYTAYDITSLLTEVKTLQQEVDRLERELNLNGEHNRLSAILARVGTFAMPYLKLLEVERAEDPVLLDPKNLTLRIISKNREDYLWEVGSGANWMGYHIAILLGLHQHFLSCNDSPIPSFLMIDQPSQVYFPDKNGPVISKNGARQISRSNDVEKVRNIFRALAAGTNNTSQRLQIMIIEHAGEDTWEGVENVHLVAKWGPKEKLIPNDW